MITIDAKQQLENNIRLLESEQNILLIQIKDQAYQLYNNVQPLNLIKRAYQDISTSPEIRSSLLHDAIGLTTGYLSKKILIGSTHNPIKKILGALVQLAIGNIVSNNSESIRSGGEYIVRRIRELGTNKKSHN